MISRVSYAGSGKVSECVQCFIKPRGIMGEMGRAPDLLVALVAKSLGYRSRICANPLRLSSSNEPHGFTADVLSSAKLTHGKISILGNLHPLTCPVWYHFGDGAVLHPLPSAP